MKPGDRVRLANGEAALVVCDFDNHAFTAAYPEADWGGHGYIGILVVNDAGARIRLDRDDVVPDPA